MIHRRLCGGDHSSFRRRSHSLIAINSRVEIAADPRRVVDSSLTALYERGSGTISLFTNLLCVRSYSRRRGSSRGEAGAEANGAVRRTETEDIASSISHRRYELSVAVCCMGGGATSAKAVPTVEQREQREENMRRRERDRKKEEKT